MRYYRNVIYAVAVCALMIFGVYIIRRIMLYYPGTVNHIALVNYRKRVDTCTNVFAVSMVAAFVFTYFGRTVRTDSQGFSMELGLKTVSVNSGVYIRYDSIYKIALSKKFFFFPTLVINASSSDKKIKIPCTYRRYRKPYSEICSGTAEKSPSAEIPGNLAFFLK